MTNNRNLILVLFLFLCVLVQAAVIRVVVAPNDSACFSKEMIQVKAGDTIKFVFGGNPSVTPKRTYRIFSNGVDNAFKITGIMNKDVFYSPNSFFDLFHSNTDSIAYFIPTSYAVPAVYIISATQPGSLRKSFYLKVRYEEPVDEFNFTSVLKNGVFNSDKLVVDRGDLVRIKFEDKDASSYILRVSDALFPDTVINSGEFNLTEAIKKGYSGNYTITVEKKLGNTSTFSFLYIYIRSLPQ